MSGSERFVDRYGPWGLVAGGSEGLGAAFAHHLASRGLDLVLVARRKDLLEETAKGIEEKHRVRVRALPLDLAESGDIEALYEQTSDLPVGLLIYNAAVSPIGHFLQQESETHRKVIELNCLSAQKLAHWFGLRMVSRRRGGIILMSSMASLQGTALVAHYAATKAYLRVLAEGLWEELRPLGVDMLASCPGMVDTPAYRSTNPDQPRWLVLTPSSVDAVAVETLNALGRQPVVVPGLRNRIATALTQRVLPRRWAVSLASAGTRRLYE